MNDYVVVVLALLFAVVLGTLGWTLRMALQLRQALHVARTSSVILADDSAHTAAVSMNHVAHDAPAHDSGDEHPHNAQTTPHRGSDDNTNTDNNDDNNSNHVYEAASWQQDGSRNLSPVELAGVAIENRVRPRRHLPKGIVVIEHADQHVVIDFNRLPDTLPQAGPPPLTREELAKLEAAQRRVASPEYYGRAEYLAAAAAAAAISRAGSVAGGSVYNHSCGSLNNCSFDFVRGCDASHRHRRRSRHSLSPTHDRHTTSRGTSPNKDEHTYDYHGKDRPTRGSSGSSRSSRNCSSENSRASADSHASRGSACGRRRDGRRMHARRMHHALDSRAPDEKTIRRQRGSIDNNDDSSSSTGIYNQAEKRDDDVVSDAGSMHGRVRARRQTRSSNAARVRDREEEEEKDESRFAHRSTASGASSRHDTGPHEENHAEHNDESAAVGLQPRQKRVLVLQDGRRRAHGHHRRGGYRAHSSYLDSTSDDFDDNDYVNNNSLVNEGVLFRYMAAASQTPPGASSATVEQRNHHSARAHSPTSHMQGNEPREESPSSHQAEGHSRENYSSHVGAPPHETNKNSASQTYSHVASRPQHRDPLDRAEETQDIHRGDDARGANAVRSADAEVTDAASAASQEANGAAAAPPDRLV